MNGLDFGGMGVTGSLLNDVPGLKDLQYKPPGIGFDFSKIDWKNILSHASAGLGLLTSLIPTGGSPVGGTLKGAASGALSGMAGGPIGAGIGAGLGGITGLLGGKEGKPKPQVPVTPITLGGMYG